MTTFTNSNTLSIPTYDGSFHPVSESLSVSGLTGTISNLTITFTVNYPYLDDLDFLLVAPDGTHNLEFLSDAGDNNGVPASGSRTFTISDAGATEASHFGNVVSGTTYKPTDYETPLETGSTNFGAPSITVNHPDPSGVATLASAFGNISPNGTWTLYVVVDNNDGTGSLSSFSLDITAASGTPVIGNLAGDSVTFTEGGAAVALDAGGNATVTDPDSANFNGGNVTVSITGNRDAAEDVLGIKSTGNGAGQIGVSGSTVSYGGTAIGTFTGGTGTNDLVISLNSNATPTATQALVRALTYSDSNSIGPDIAPRTVSVTLTDDTGNTSTVSNVAVTVTATGDDPMTTFTNSTTVNIPDAPAAAVSSTINVAGFGAGVHVKDVAVTITGLTVPNGNGPGDFDFLLASPDGRAFEFFSDAVNTTLGENSQTFILADYGTAQLPTGGTGSDGGTYRAADYGPAGDETGTYFGPNFSIVHAAPTGVAGFGSVFGGDAPNGDWTLYVRDDSAGGGLGSFTGWSISIATDAVGNQAPVISNLNGDTVTFTEEGTAVALDVGGDASVVDIDSANFDTGTLKASITANKFSTEDVLKIDTSGNVHLSAGMTVGSTVSVGATAIGTIAANGDGLGGHDLIVTLNANATPALVTDVVEAIDYFNSNTINPNINPRTVSVTVSDGDGGTSGAANVTVNVTALNDDNPTLFSSSTASGTIPDGPNGAAYSDTINVGLTGVVADVAVTITGLSHTSISDLDFLLVSPDGTHNLEFFSDAGGVVSVSGINVTVADYGTSPLPNGSGLTTGTYRAADYGLPVEPDNYFGPTTLTLNHATTSGTATFASAFGGASANGNWTLYVRDGQSGDTGSFTGWSLSISLANNAPVLDATKTPVLNAVNEDPGAPSGAVGTLISSLVDLNPPAGGLDNVTDSDSSPVTGIALTHVDTTHGTWFYSISGGATWSAVGAPTDSSALLLAANATTRLYFQPSTDFNGTVTAAITFRAWDQSSGTNGGSADTSTNGANTAFSTATDTADITVNAVNDPPVVTSGGNTSYTELASAVFANSGLTVTDVDSANLVGATVAITNALTGDELTINGTTSGDVGSIHYSFSSGTLTLTGTDSVSNYQAALDAVKFDSTSHDPTNGNSSRTLNWQADDGGSPLHLSNVATSSIAITAVNDAPGLSVPASYSGTPGNAVTINGITFSDVDGETGAEVATFSAAAGTFSAATVAGVTIGNNNSNNLTLTGTLTNLNNYISGNNLTYTSTTSQQITVDINDQGNTGGGALHTSLNSQVSIEAPPTIANLANDTATFVEGGTLLLLDRSPAAIVSDTDSTDFNGGNLTVSIAIGDIAAEDALSIIAGNGITVSSGAVSYNSNVIGTVAGGTSGNPLVVTFTTTAATPAATSALIGQIAYQNTNNADPSATDRVVRFTVNDGDGATSSNYDVTVHVTPVNDPPVVGGAANSVGYTEQAAAIQLDSSITVNDVDNTTLTGATVKISAGYQPGDTLHFTNQNGITGTYDAANATLTLTGTSLVANYQTALASVTFDNASNDNPTDFGLYATRTIDWQVNDGTALPNPFFSSATTFGTGSRPYSVALGDFNGDGKLDLAVANFGSGNVSVLSGNGDGTFAAATNFAAGNGPTSVAIADFNGDGKRDLAVANANSDNVSVLLGDGLGGFGAATNFAVGTAPYAVAAADLNGDGKIDLVTANSASDNISIRLGNGAGSFAPATNIAVGGEPESIAIGDFNGDGKLDLAIGNVSSGNVSVLLGTGNGSFGAATNFSVGTAPVSVATGDLNGDGKADLAVANSGSGNVTVLFGNGSGGFPTSSTFAAGTGAYSVAIADVNGDGIPDLVVGNNGSGNVSVLLGTGGGNFAAAVNFAAGSSIVPVAVGDFDGTGGPDIVVANEITSGTVSVLLNQSTALSAVQHTIVNFTAVNDPPTFVSGFNNAVGFTENGSAVTLSSSGVIADADSLTLAGATAQITTGLLSGDTLAVNLPTTSGVIDGTNITVSYTAGTGLLTLSGTDTLANYQNAIDHVQYVTASDDPTSGGDNSRIISWQLNDGAGSNNLSTTTTTTQVNITAINDEPTLTATAANPTYHENDAPATLFSAAAASTIESGQTITSMTLTVSGLADGANELLFIDGSNVALVNGNSIVTATHSLTVNVSVSGSTATASFTGATLSASAVQTLVNSLGYSDGSDTPSETNRTVTITQIVDSGSSVSPNDNTASVSIASTVGVVAVDDAPVLTGLTDTPAFVENGSSVLLDTNQNASVSDPELNVSANHYAGASLTLERSGGPNADDSFVATGNLDVTDVNGNGDNVSLDGGVTFIGKFVDNGDGSVKFTFNANATATDIGSVMRQIAYSNGSDNPPTTVPVNFIFDDGSGEAGGQPQGTGTGITTATVNVQITQVDDAPALLNVAVGATYLVNTPGTVLSPGLQVADLDAVPPSTLTGIASATVEITAGFLAGDQFFVNLPTSGGFFIIDDGNGPVVTNISVQSNSGGQLVVSGQDTTQHYQDVLDAVNYHSTAADPTNGGADPTRTIEWHVSDGSLDNAAPSVPHYPETTLGFESNVAPTDISLTPADVPENSPNGTVVGVFGSTDPNIEDVHTYTLLDSAGGAFAISGVQLVVANSSLLDYEQHSSEQITVRSTDLGGLFVDKVMTVAVDNVEPEIVGGTSGNDTILGGALTDVINGGAGDDVVVGNGGDDWLGGGSGNDHVSGGAGNDTIWGEDGNDTLGGGDGNDSIIGGAGNDTRGGDDGNDIINGGDGNDTVFGGSGDDLLGGASGDDTINGGDGNDTIWGEDGNDTIVGGAGNDVVMAGAGDDNVGGGTGNDSLFGSDGSDQLWGEDGDDFLIGGAGDDTMTGGAGHDAFVFSPGDGHDTITDFTVAASPNSDYIWLAGTDLHNFADVVAHETFNVATGATTITYNGTNTITINNTTPTQLTQDHFILT